MMNDTQTQVLPIGLRSGPAWYSQPWWGGDTLAARQYSLLRLLALGNRERLNIVPLIFCLAAEHRGYYRRVLTNLGLRIEEGASLVAALEQTPDALSDEDVLALRLAGESGTWAQTFEELLELRLEDQRAARLRPQISVGYWMVVLLLCSSLLGILMAVVAPTFMAIGREFGARSPDAFVSLIRFVSSQALGWVMLFAVSLVLWFSCFRAPRRFFQRRVAPNLVPPVAQQQLVELYRLLAIALDAGRPLTGALSTLARYHFNRTLRNRLLFARNEVEQGVDTWQGLSQSRLIVQKEADALSESPNSSIAAWTLRELARKKFITASRRTAALTILIEPVLTLLFGGFVLWVCFAFFQYLVTFISSV